MSSIFTPNYPPPARKSKEEMIQDASQKSGSSFLTPNYPPPRRKSKEEMLAEASRDTSQKSGSSFLTPNYPPPRRKTKEEMLAEASGFSDEIGTSVPHQPLKFDWKFFLIAMAVLVGVFGTIIGILVGRNTNLDTSSDATMAPTEMTNTTTITTTISTVDLDCDMMTMNFTANNLVLTMSVQSGISGIEIDYATAVLEKTYTSMLQNELTQSLSQYCDPYCRKIDSITILSNKLITAETAESRQTGDCDASLVLTFSVEGTFIGCEDTEFPGLFAPGRRQLVEVQTSKVRRNLNAPRFLEPSEEMDGMDMCPSCPDDSNTLGLTAPTVTRMSELLDGFVAVLPAICEVTGAEIVDP
jgi:hypothetical protein